MNYVEVTLPNYSYIFNFEQEFMHHETHVWMRENWTYGFYYVGLYMILIFGGQYYMQSRPKYELRGVLSLWNTLLAGFSIMGACRTAPELLHTLKNYGLYHSVCVPSFIEQDKVSGFWSWMFVLSKLPELGDTIFIVLRKQPLIFLHWYHHITVLLYAWFSYTETTSSARWFIVMNYCVHSVMYSYYALKSMGYRPYRYIQFRYMGLRVVVWLCLNLFLRTICVLFFGWFESSHNNLPLDNMAAATFTARARVPLNIRYLLSRWKVQMIITTLQLIQMVVGCFVNIWAYNFINSRPNSSTLENGQHFCHVSNLNIKLSIAMYFSYFVLFSRFFYKSYINKGYRVKEHSPPNTFDPSIKSKSQKSSKNDNHKTKAH